MFTRNALPFSLLFISAILHNVSSTVLPRATVSSLRDLYTKPHSLGESYTFGPRDGWTIVNVTNLQYKYRPGVQADSDQDLIPRHKGDKKTSKYHSKAKKLKFFKSLDIGSSIAGAYKSLVAKVGFKGLGTAEEVKITWYTGHDLLNPSCWPESGWAPTDTSFVCALTLEGWLNRPKCFNFLELCTSPKKCIFVRVVDTCAGCEKGSKHVDLTKGSFSELANPDDGVLMVNMREATHPKDLWFEDLWGPQH